MSNVQQNDTISIQDLQNVIDADNSWNYSTQREILLYACNYCIEIIITT